MMRGRMLIGAVVLALLVGGGAFVVGRMTAGGPNETSLVTGSAHDLATVRASAGASPNGSTAGGEMFESSPSTARSSGGAQSPSAGQASPGASTRPATDASDAARSGAGTKPSPTPQPGKGTSGATVTIAAAGDIACDPGGSGFKGGAGSSGSCRQMATSDLVLSLRPAAVLTLGDDQYESATLDAFNRSYGPSWGRFKALTHPAAGNHEYNGNEAAGYFAYFGSAAGPAGRGYYSYDLGAWHLVVLNSNCDAVSCSPGSAQETWLKADLASHRNQCTLAYWHHPRWSHGEHGDNAEVAPFVADLYRAGADVILNGHDHDYERFTPRTPSGAGDSAKGIREFVVGTGGRSHYQTGSGPGTEAMNDTTFGVLSMTLKPAGYSWRFVPVAGSSYTDSGSGSCH